MRKVAEVLRDNGIYSLSLRMPGHGTIPSGLVTAAHKAMQPIVLLYLGCALRFIELFPILTSDLLRTARRELQQICGLLWFEGNHA